ncbi:MAG TPA: FkbM family methyltransferase [Stenotrophomonas sp.]|nr:FkbM family methyltransferase [Stenotrophomonas sp.]
MTLDLAEHMQRRIFWMGYYNLRLVPLFDRLLKPGMVVADVGANIGEVSLLAANRVGAGGRVIAFEPAPDIADALEAHVRGNALEEVISVCRQGLADVAGVLPLYGSCGQGSAQDPNRGLGSLHGNPDSDPLIALVEVTTLDAVVKALQLPRLDLLKVDIEGGELPCLRGALDTIERFRPVVVVEVHAHSAGAAGCQGRDILDLLTPLGYRFHRLEKRGRLVPISAEQLGAYQDVVCIAGERLPVEPG